jgi:hypothetical protein
MPYIPADYVRPSPPCLTIEQKRQLLAEQVAYYTQVRAEKSEKEFRRLMSQKLSRRLVSRTLARIGGLIQQETRELASGSSEEAQNVQNFLAGVPLPPAMNLYLTTEYRTFALLLNALKQWISAEQAATDRFLLGGAARGLCRQVSTQCLITRVAFEPEHQKELHHIVRDGRPPIALSKEGHRIVDNQVSHNDAWRQALQSIKKNRSWIALRRGCDAILADTDAGVGDKNWAKKALQEVQKIDAAATCEKLIIWLDEQGLGL